MNQLLPKGIWTALLAVGVLTLGQARPGEAVSGQAGKKTRSNKTVEELCQPSRAQTDLDLNNVRTTIMGGGDMWWDLNVARYEIPKGSNRHSMFAGALWLGGLDEGGQLKLAAMTYRSRGNDFWPGPLSTDGLASVNKDICDKYDRHWIIYREQVDLHRAWLLCKNDPDCDPGEKFPGYEGSIPEIILEWPAHGVDGDLPYTLAPFIDLDGDNRYDPLEDYPAYDFDRAFDCRKKETDVLYGDMTLWWVYNDRGNVHTETSAGALGFEIRAQAFAFSTNDEINNMTFNNYRILNKSTFRLTNTYFSTWFDPDLGNYTDDIIGCDIPRGLGYVYNADNNDEGPIGYGFNPPAVAMDFFQGPFADYFDGLDNDRDGCVDGIRDANGVCQPENPVTGLNERIIMSGFMYYNAGNAATGDPRNASEFYNYMQSRWRNGNPLVVENPSGPGNTSNGDGFTQDGTGLATKFAYPGNTFDTTLQNDPKAPQNWFESPDNKQDKRGLHNAGPFSLAPGALNFITTGVVWEREYNKQGLFASVEKVIIADDKAQALFDNCFQILNGPDAPELTIQELDRELILMMSYREGANNQALDYEEVDPLIRNADNKYRFEGFQVFQLASKNASIGDRYDPSQAKLVAQCDIKNGVDRLVNWELDPDLDLVVPQDMTLNAENGGIKLSFKLSEDAFATGQDRRFVNHKEYYFTVVAYAYNEYAPYNPSTGSDGQRRPFLSGRNNVKRYLGIPHKIESEDGGTVINTAYGFKPPVTRIEGLGNGGGVLRLDPASESEILTTVFANGYMPNPKYLGGYGPVNVKVVDPLTVPEGEYYLIFDGVGGNARWSIQDKATGEVIANSMTSIKVLNEQIVPKLGMSVEISDVEAPGLDEDGVRNGGLLASDVVYSDPTKTWYKGIADDDSYSPYNWVLAGPNDLATAAPAKFYKDIPNDPKGFFETILGGTWAPFYYVSSLGRGMAEGTTIYGMGPADSAMQVSLRLEPKNLQSVDVVFTKDPAKWTRVPVFEMGEDEALTQGGASKFTLRRASGWDKSNGQLVPGATTGWSYFPGYAINVETGTRLNMAFGENSWMLSDNGGDMKFNPTSRERIFPQDPVTGGFRFGGQHYIYIFAPSVRKGTTVVDLSYKGDDPTAHPLYNEITNLNTGTNRQTFTRSIMWCSLGMVQPQYQGVDLYTDMPSDLRVRIRTARPYEKLAVDNSNAGNPKYLFSTAGIATGRKVNAVAKSALDNIRVVPNPYLSQSAYESSQLDNLVKITNLPENCVVSVYSTDGSLVRTLRKDNKDTWMYWDLKNNYGVPIASGVYIIHIQADNIGEKVIKWFGTMRPFDPTGF